MRFTIVVDFSEAYLACSREPPEGARLGADTGNAAVAGQSVGWAGPSYHSSDQVNAKEKAIFAQEQPNYHNYDMHPAGLGEWVFGFTPG